VSQGFFSWGTKITLVNGFEMYVTDYHENFVVGTATQELAVLEMAHRTTANSVRWIQQYIQLGTWEQWSD
jgi:hypothetical protein